MRYDEFRNEFLLALRTAGLEPHLGRPAETMDLTTTTRHWGSAVGDFANQTAEPFHVSASIAFEWDPFDSARTYTTEDDLVTELLGRDEDPPETMPRHLRTDIVLRATLPYDARVRMPDQRLWKDWSLSVDHELARFLPTQAPGHEGGIILVMGFRGTVEVESKCSDEGELCLSGVSLPSWQAVVPPRILDGAEEEPEGDIARQLERLARRYRSAYLAWMDCVTSLRDEMGLESED